MNYPSITEQQLDKKFNSLPTAIKEFLNSEKNVETVGQICRSHHLDEEKSLMIEQLIGLVALGFIHPEEITVEIQENLYLNHKHSIELADEIDRKIFSPIKAEIEKIYLPVVSEKAETKPPLEEVLDLREKYKEKPVEPPRFDPSVFSSIKEMPASPPVPPKPSHIEPPVLNRVEVPKFTIGNRPEAGRIETPKVVSIGEKELEIEPPPMIIHKQTQFKPLTPITETKKSLGGFFSFLRKEKKENKPPSVMAKVEIGPKPKIEPPKARPTSPASELAGGRVRVVHYSEFDTPITPPVSPPPPSKVEAPKPQEPKPFIVNQPSNLQSPTPFMPPKPEPPVNLPVAKPETPKSPEPPKIKTPMEKTILDLRTAAGPSGVFKAGHTESLSPPLVKPAEPPKPIQPAPPKPPEPPKPAPKPQGPEGEMIDLRGFK